MMTMMTIMMDPSNSSSDTNHAIPGSESESVLVDFNEFLEDVELRLGRANGNMFHRKDGIEAVHDGQIMVRLKKKRWIVIDYGIVPTEHDLQTAALNPHVSTPDGAGRTQCVHPDCTKIGIPVLLHDSEPTEPASLYMRSGLCFACQRHLNEKRRTQRKRKSDVMMMMEGTRNDDGSLRVTLGNNYNNDSNSNNHGEPITLQLTADAIVIDGPFDHIRSFGDCYHYQDIGIDIRLALREATLAMEKLTSAVAGPSSTLDDTSSSMTDDVDAVAVAVAAAVAETPVSDEAINAAVDATHDMMAPVANDDITTLYHKAWDDMVKALFLMKQWKGSWDSVVTAAVAQETLDPNLEGAVAAAASIAAAGQEQQEQHEQQNSSTMMSLLVAAEAKGDDHDDDHLMKQVQEDVHEV
jgi:hypothetical protein